MTALTYPVARHRLGNGLRVVVTESRLTSAVAVNLRIGVGSRDEIPGRTGYAHLLEHLVLHAGDGEEAAADAHRGHPGRRGGDVNATTSFDRTNYTETVTADALERALQLASRRMRTLPRTLDQRLLDRERGVVQEERRQVVDNHPYGSALERALTLLFPADHPYGHLPIGSPADVDAATVADVRSFFEQHYLPRNAVLSLAGHVTPEEGFALARQYFDDVPDLAPAETTQVEPLPPLAAPVRQDVVTRAPSAALFMAFRAPGLPSDELDALELAVSILTAGGVSRLHRRLVRDTPLAQVVSGSVQRLDGTGFSQLVLVGAPGASEVAMQDAATAELERLICDGPTEEEVQAAQAQSERTWLDALASCAGRADALGGYTMLFDTPESVNDRVEHVRAVTAERIRAAAAHWLRPDSRAVVAFHGQEPS